MQIEQENLGSGGNCVCPKCGNKVTHQAGKPCKEERCPNCGAKMVREGSSHHQLIEAKKKKKEAV